MEGAVGCSCAEFPDGTGYNFTATTSNLHPRRLTTGDVMTIRFVSTAATYYARLNSVDRPYDAIPCIAAPLIVQISPGLSEYTFRLIVSGQSQGSYYPWLYREADQSQHAFPDLAFVVGTYAHLCRPLCVSARYFHCRRSLPTFVCGGRHSASSALYILIDLPLRGLCAPLCV